MYRSQIVYYAYTCVNLKESCIHTLTSQVSEGILSVNPVRGQPLTITAGGFL